MRITVKQLKKLIRETVEDIDPMDLERQAENLPSNKEDMFQLYSDMYKEMYNIRPRWLRMNDVSEDELRAMIEHLEDKYADTIKQRNEEAKREEEYFQEIQKEREEADKAKAELASLGYEGEDLENLPMRSGMGKRLAESIKKAVREAVEEAIEEKENELVGDQHELDVAPPFGKLTKDDFGKLRSMNERRMNATKKN